ncbi:MAG: tetratricopeptide repeat protein [Clostridia bacterium]|nr:tetratricopeptide repeat protein [Clostridia bacterium]
MEYVMQGKTLYHMDRYEEALTYFDKAEKTDPMYKPTYFAQGECYIMLDRFDDARDAYEKALMLDKKDGEVYFHLGNVAFLKDDEKVGREYYAKAIANGFEDPQLYMNTGFMLFNEGSYEESIEQFNKALAKDEFMAEAWIHKAKAFVNLDKPNQAIQALSNMIELLPEVADGYHFKFMLEMGMKLLGEAEKTINKALHFFPNSGDLCYDRLLLLEAQDKPEEALKYINDVFPDTQEPILLLEKAKLLSVKDGCENEADAIFDKLIDGEDEKIGRDAAFAKAVMKMAYNKLSQSVETLEKVMAKEEHTVDYFIHAIMYAQLLDRLERRPEAEIKIRELLPEIRMACVRDKDLSYYLLRAMYHRFVGELDQALEMIDFLISVQPEMGDAYYVRSLIYDDIHEPEKAEADRQQMKAYGAEISRFLNA